MKRCKCLWIGLCMNQEQLGKCIKGSSAFLHCLLSLATEQCEHAASRDIWQAQVRWDLGSCLLHRWAKSAEANPHVAILDNNIAVELWWQRPHHVVPDHSIVLPLLVLRYSAHRLCRNSSWCWRLRT